MILPDYSSERNIWVETTTLEHKHGGSPEWDLGAALWSPTKDKGGKAIYELMREPIPGDLVLHILKSGSSSNVKGAVLSGYSFVAKKFEIVVEQPPVPGEWGGKSPYYRIKLEGFSKLEYPVELNDFMEECREELLKIYNTNQEYLFYCQYNEDLRLNQGKYLTKMPCQIYNLFRGVEEIEQSQKEVEKKVFKEGAEQRIVMTTKERNPYLRKDAIKKYGRICMVCGFDFDKVYGRDIAKGYIEVHHEKMLSDIPGEREVTVDEVKVVCSNCHRVIHRKKKMLDWKFVRNNLKK